MFSSLTQINPTALWWSNKIFLTHADPCEKRISRMPRRATDFDTVRTYARALGEIEETLTRGAPAIKVQGQLLAWMPIKKSVEPGTLGVRIGFDDRAELLAAAPDIYYLVDHYNDYPAVLVRLSLIPPDMLKDLLLMSWRFVTTKLPAKKRKMRG